MALIYNKPIIVGSEKPVTVANTISTLPESIKAGSFVNVNQPKETVKSFGSTVAPKPSEKTTERRFSYYEDMKTVQKRS